MTIVVLRGENDLITVGCYGHTIICSVLFS